MKRELHITDEELLRGLDGELSNRESCRVQEHLAACWACRGRGAELERAIEDFVAAYRDDIDKPLPPIEGPRALLRARLNQLQQLEPTTSWRSLWQSIFQAPKPLYAGITVGILALIGFSFYSGVRQVRADSIPDSALTPGAKRTAQKDELCSASSTKGFYPIPATLAYRVFEKYKIRNPKSGSYEVDYLITPALGGADDIRNLWPQPYTAGEWNAHVKDALEDYLHKRVCAGELDLGTAQRDIAVNWIAAYQKYFKTQRPLPLHETFSVDAPWQD